MIKYSGLAVSPDCALNESLSAIRQTQVQLHGVTTDMKITAAVLASRIELCDTLLCAISGIRNSLARDLQCTRQPPLALN